MASGSVRLDRHSKYPLHAHGNHELSAHHMTAVSLEELRAAEY